MIPFGSSRVFLSVNFRLVCTTKNIINAHIIKFRKPNQCFCWRYSFSILEFRKQRLLNPRLHLQGNLCISSAFSQLFQPGLHNITQ